MPAMFVGHGSPMNAIESNGYSQSWRAAGEALPRPKAIVVVSAHWYADGAAVTAMDRPRTIHDFYGFPRDLYAVQYPAQGSPDLAARIARLASPFEVSLDQAWGLDHGAWSVLVHLFPAADIPVVQLAIDARQPAAFHWELGAALAPLRDEGVLILGSGNIVHNLRMADFGARGGYDWALRFDEYARAAIQAGDRDALVRYERHPDGSLAVPTPEHYLPLLYVVSLRREGETVTTVVDGIEAGSLSMRSVRIG
ncbi:MAG TPA: 4,5-DOPA dioxygenase extradiol [Candidatus Tumulicola sp.]